MGYPPRIMEADRRVLKDDFPFGEAPCPLPLLERGKSEINMKDVPETRESGQTAQITPFSWALTSIGDFFSGKSPLLWAAKENTILAVP